ncbi:hypothetical protein Q5P01_002172 [Channa striata]|uniref:Secreted protein n=1 Tax=Channa striata TaxID=64152 RepID=A0AA88T7T7_CHASR|nr:hypothetical protein Q5P01_002172 [Channa striata]
MCCRGLTRFTLPACMPLLCPPLLASPAPHTSSLITSMLYKPAKPSSRMLALIPALCPAVRTSACPSYLSSQQ